LPWALLVTGSIESMAANVAVAEPTATGRVIAAWPSFALIGSYELLMRQVRRAAGRTAGKKRVAQRRGVMNQANPASPQQRRSAADAALHRAGGGGELQREAWQWALAHRAGDGSLPSGQAIARQYGRQERWGRLVKQAGLEGGRQVRPGPFRDPLRGDGRAPAFGWCVVAD
jgi:hypothetical protein